MKKIIKRFLSRKLNQNKINGTTVADTKMIKVVLKNIDSLSIDLKSEEEHVRKWSKLLNNVSPLWFRAYSNLLKNSDINIIPDNIYHSIVEPILNDYSYSFFYEEKNFYDFIFSPEFLPITILRNIDGVHYNAFYEKIEFNNEVLTKIFDKKKIIVKPTIDTGSGKNVNKFVYNTNNQRYEDKVGLVLSAETLTKQYSKNYIVQECLAQSEFMNQFNASSVNTFRVLTYKSVIDNEIKILHVTLRVGLKGSHLDNAHAGGRFCGVSKEGMLTKVSFNDKGEISNFINDINLNNEFVIPQINNIIEFSKKIAGKIYHQRILSLDIMLDNNDKPRLVEINPRGQGVFIFQMTNGAMLGEYTDEIIDYCSKKIDKFFNHYSINI